MDQLESVGTTPSHIAVSDRPEAHRRSSEKSKSGGRARHGGSMTWCRSVVNLFPDTADPGSNPIRQVSIPRPHERRAMILPSLFRLHINQNGPLVE